MVSDWYGGRQLQTVYQYGTALASISSVASPEAEIPGNQVLVGVLVVNKGQDGTIYVDMQDSAAFVLADFQFLALGPGASEFFILSAVMPSQPTTYVVRVGHVILDALGATQTIIDDTTTFLVGVAGIIEGQIPPAGATDAFVINAAFGNWILDLLRQQLVNFFTPLIAESQGVSVVRVDTLPERGKIIIWVKSPMAKEIASQIIVKILSNKLFWEAVIIGIIGITAVSLASDYVIVTTKNADLRRDIAAAQITCLNTPGLTDAEKLQCQANLAKALPSDIPYGLIVGGVVVSAGVLAIASVLSKRGGTGDFFSFFADRPRQWWE